MATMRRAPADRGLVVESVDPRELLPAEAPFLVAREAQHSLLLGLADRMRARSDDVGGAYAARVRGDRGTVLVALWTPPQHLLLSAAAEPGAVDLVATDLARAGADLFGVHGPPREARRFARSWARLTGAHGVLDMRTRVLQVTRVRQPPTVAPGFVRFATNDDVHLLADWTDAFRAEALPNEPGAVPGADVVATWMSREEPIVWIWDDDGPVAMAVATVRTPNGVRIGGVYTPPAHRNRGYASSLIAAASQGELDRGRAMCYLDADVTNHNATRIYESVGYVAVGEVEVHRFAG
jgi:predicted GNAT family acetyltransferase